MQSFTESERHLQSGSSNRRAVKKVTNQKMKNLLEEEKKGSEEVSLSDKTPSDDDYHPDAAVEGRLETSFAAES